MPKDKKQVDDRVEFPHRDGDHLVLGPEIFTDVGKQVICWKGVNYVPQENIDDMATLQYQASARLVALQLVLSNEQKDVLAVLDVLGGTTLMRVTRHGMKTPECIVRMRHDESGLLFTIQPDGVMRTVVEADEEDDDRDEED